MPIEIQCECGKRYRVNENLTGKRVRCKACQGAILVEEIVDLDAAAPTPPPLPGGTYADASWPEAFHAVAPAVAANRSGVRDSRMPPPPAYDVSPEIPGATPGSWQTMASNPALLRLRPIYYLTNHPGQLIVLGGWVAISVPYFFGRYPWIGAIILALGVAWFLFNLYRLTRMLGHGCVNPATVVSTNPWRLGIFTDLAMSDTPRPAVKIISAPLGRINGGQLRVGDRLAVVALYGPGTDPDAWDDIDERIIHFVTPHADQVARIMYSIPRDEWEEMERYVPSVDTTKLGIYKCWKSGKDRFKPHNPATLWVVFGIFCFIVIGLGVATYDGSPSTRSTSDPTPASTREPVRSPSPPAVRTPTPPAVPAPPPTRTPANVDSPFAPGERPPALRGPDIQKLTRAHLDNSLEKVEMLDGGEWKQGRVIKRVPEQRVIFVYFEGTVGSGRWFKEEHVRPR